MGELVFPPRSGISLLFAQMQEQDPCLTATVADQDMELMESNRQGGGVPVHMAPSLRRSLMTPGATKDLYVTFYMRFQNAGRSL